MKILNQIQNFILKTSIRNSTIKQYYDCADFIDFILLYLDAGVNIQNSFFQAISNLEPGELKNSSLKIISHHKIGMSFAETLKEVLKDDGLLFVFREVLENIQLSLKLGSSLSQILTHLSFHFRLIATSRLEEIANEAPIKMIFPLVIFIFPVIFILLGSGAIENLVRSFQL